MTAENQENDIGNLGRTWGEKLKNIRSKAKEDRENGTEYPSEAPEPENATEVSPDSELAPAQVDEELSEQQAPAVMQDNQTADNLQPEVAEPKSENATEVSQDGESAPPQTNEEQPAQQAPAVMENAETADNLQPEVAEPELENATEVSQDDESAPAQTNEEQPVQQAPAVMENAETADNSQSSDESQAATAPTNKYKRFSAVQKILIVSIIATAAMLSYALLKSPSDYDGLRPDESAPAADTPSVPATQQTSQHKPAPAFVSQKATGSESISASPETALIKNSQAHMPLTPQPVQQPKLIPDSTQSLSLQDARSSYLNRDYKKALLLYEELYQKLSENPQEHSIAAFLQLRMAMCMEKTADREQASLLFRSAANSCSPVVRVFANYHRSILEMQKKQYLTARNKAYKAIALIDAVHPDKDWSLSLKHDCHFLAAEAITKKVLSLRDADKNLPEDLWQLLNTAKDPFIELSETQLRAFLDYGSEQLNKALLSPQIQRSNQSGGTHRYTVTCYGASLEDLLARFAANADLDVRWALEPNEIGMRKQAINLHLSEVTAQQFVTAASGCAGLLAQLDEKGIVHVFNPDEYTYISEQTSLLGNEAVSLWQKFLLGFPEDPRLANAHFALGLLQTQNGNIAESIAECKLVTNRFPGSPLAPFALLNSSNLKADLRDYPGASQDLKQLVEQYPDTEIAEKAYLHLADVTAKMGLMTEATRLYRKLYNLCLTPESESAAAIGAGKCFYQTKDYKSAAKWLTRYIKAAKGRKNKDLYLAYSILGKTYLALENTEAATNAFQYALQGGPSQLPKEEYIETVSALVETYIQQGNFVGALNILEGVHPAFASQQESIAILLLKSRVLTAMGLVDKAIAMLGDRAEYIFDPQLKTKVSLELATCYINKGDFEFACGKLAEILVDIEPGPLAHETNLKLADACLKLGQDSRASFICLQLLESEPPEQIKQKALDLLATAYNRQKDYDRATLALLGQWNRYEN